jgi:hypothetical protein
MIASSLTKMKISMNNAEQHSTATFTSTHFANFWAKGVEGDFSCWKFSDKSQKDAQKLADDRVLQIAERFRKEGRPPDSYTYADQRLREPVITEIPDGVISRNSYGCLVLNTSNVMFVDIDFPELKDSYDEVVVIHDNNLDTFVPKALFDVEFLGSYLQYNTKVFETDFFAFDEIASYEINHVYIPYVNINNYLLDPFTTFNYKHMNSILVSKLLDLSKNVDEKQVFVHFSSTKFEIVIVQNQKLLLFNSFDFSTKEDFIYYLLFTSEQLNLNPEYYKLFILGDISEESDLYQMAYKYVRNISLLDVSELQKHNDFSTAQNSKHFILFQS